MVTAEKKNDESKQGGNPSVVDAFISALFASTGATPSPSSSKATTSSSASPYTNTTSESSSIDKGGIKSEKTPISLGTNIHKAPNDEEYIPAVRSSTDESTGKLESFSQTTATTKTAVKRERSLTEEVEAYNQLSKRKIAQPSASTNDNKRFDEREYQRRDNGRGLGGESGSMSPGRGGSDRRGFDHQHQRHQNQQNQRTQQQQHYKNISAPSSSSYRGKAEIVPYHLQAQRGQPATSTYILALKPVDWSTAVAESRMLIRDVPTHMDNWDILDHFATYGEIIEVVIKNQLGFVHFADASACQAAVMSENGKRIKDFRLKLEVCKQKPHFARGNQQPTTAKNPAPLKNIHYQPRTPSTHVHLIVWDHVPPNYVHYVSQTFERASLPIQISYLINRPASNQEQIIREKVDMGAIAVLDLEARHEQQKTVDLRVLNKSYNDNIHYEVYNSISLDDAIALSKIGCSPSRSVSKSPPQTTLARNPLPPPPPQQQQTHPPLDLAAIQQLDINTLATIYDLVHVQLEAALASHQRTASSQQQQQQQQYSYSSQPLTAPYLTAPTLSYQQPTFSHPGPTSAAPTATSSLYQYPQYPPSPQPLTSAAKLVPIPLSTEQLGNILSSVHNNNQ